jgi:hypothetical protein
MLERDAFEVVRLIRSWKNSLAPINRIPLEVLALIPDFWDVDCRDKDVIALTHVCRPWREAFISWSSLWTNFYCGKLNADKTRVYLERSKSSPITLRLGKGADLSPRGPFLQIVPRAVGRLKSLLIYGTPGNLQDITARLSHPAPLLEYLRVDGDSDSEAQHNPVLATTLFNGDLSSLRELGLESVCTELPWRNMINLTSFMLGHTLSGDVPMEKLLDFFESAPHLREIDLFYANLTFGSQNNRLVSLACLKKMEISSNDPDGPPSLLLIHLIIPIGAKLTIKVAFYVPLLEAHLPRSLDNLRNLPNFTDIHLRIGEQFSGIRLSGPNGKVTMVLKISRIDATRLVLDSLARFDTSGTKNLRIDRGNLPFSNPFYRALLPMKHLHTLTLSHCTDPDVFIKTLSSDTSSSGVIVCPKLEELVLVLCLDGETLNVEKNVIEMAEARASRGMKLKSVRIVSHDESVQIDTSELMEHVLHVECSIEVDTADEDGDSSDDEC